ncbi:unnamed protein product, partial [Heterosigma akashiwo]
RRRRCPPCTRPASTTWRGSRWAPVARLAIVPLPLRPGDAVLGLASSGVHSNGFSLVRKVLAVAGLGFGRRAPASARRGGDGGGGAASAFFQPPTPPCMFHGAARRPHQKIKALAHITGGGLPENVPRVLAADTAVRIDVAASGWTLPPVFKWL